MYTIVFDRDRSGMLPFKTRVLAFASLPDISFTAAPMRPSSPAVRLAANRLSTTGSSTAYPQLSRPFAGSKYAGRHVLEVPRGGWDNCRHDATKTEIGAAVLRQGDWRLNLKLLKGAGSEVVKILCRSGYQLELSLWACSLSRMELSTGSMSHAHDRN